MIYINKNTTNKVVLTLCELSTLDNPYYLMVFENEYELEEAPIYFTTPNISVAKQRYDEFLITESSSGSTTGGIDLPLKLTSGQYRYRVYESATQTLDINDTTGVIIEEGRMVVEITNEVNQNLSNNTESIYL